MPIPFSDAIADRLLVSQNSGSGAGIATRVKSGGSWRWSDQLYAKTGGSWQRVRQAYVKTGGTWQTWHHADDVYTFYIELPINPNWTYNNAVNLPPEWNKGYGTANNHLNAFNLYSWLKAGVYTSPSLGRTYQDGDILRGHIKITGDLTANAMIGDWNDGSYGGVGMNIDGTYGALQIPQQAGNTNESRIYVEIASGKTVGAEGGRGGNTYGTGSNPYGQNGGDAMMIRKPTYIENNGNIWAGGGGGGSGNNGVCVGTYYYNYNCGKNCYRQGSGNNYNTAYGSGGGGGAGNPAGNGGKGGDGRWSNDGSNNAGGNAANHDGCNSYKGGKGGNPGQDGSNASYNGGQAGRYIWGYGFATWITTGDRRGRTS